MCLHSVLLASAGLGATFNQGGPGWLAVVMATAGPCRPEAPGSVWALPHVRVSCCQLHLGSSWEGSGGAELPSV